MLQVHCSYLVRAIDQGCGSTLNPGRATGGVAVEFGLTRQTKLKGQGVDSMLQAYVLNRYSRIPVAQPHEYEYRIPPG